MLSVDLHMDFMKVCEGVVRSTGKECTHIAKYDNNTRCGFHRDKRSVLKKNGKKHKRIEYGQVELAIDKVEEEISKSEQCIEKDILEMILAITKPLIHLIENQNEKIEQILDYVRPQEGVDITERRFNSLPIIKERSKSNRRTSWNPW